MTEKGVRNQMHPDVCEPFLANSGSSEAAPADYRCLCAKPTTQTCRDSHPTCRDSFRPKGAIRKASRRPGRSAPWSRRCPHSASCRGRSMLLKLTLGHRNRASVAVEQDGTRRGRTLIDRQHMVGSPHVPTIRSAARPRKASRKGGQAPGLIEPPPWIADVT